MRVNTQEIMDKGYIILQQVIPLDILEELRRSFEELVHREWPDGLSDGHQQPRIHGFQKHINEVTASTVEFCLHENTLDVCRQLLRAQECDAVEAVFRAIINKDEDGFREGLATLHPGATGRCVCLIHLCKIAQRVQQGNDREYSPRFNPEEIQMLWKRFAPLDEALQADEEQYIPGFLARSPSRYRFYDLPKDFDIDPFVASWEN